MQGSTGPYKHWFLEGTIGLYVFEIRPSINRLSLVTLSYFNRMQPIWRTQLWNELPWNRSNLPCSHKPIWMVFVGILSQTWRKLVPCQFLQSHGSTTLVKSLYCNRILIGSEVFFRSLGGSTHASHLVLDTVLLAVCYGFSWVIPQLTNYK